MFAKALTDPKIQKLVSSHDDGWRIYEGVPDHPFSLMEGLSGDICFLSDLLRDESEARFPAYEI